MKHILITHANCMDGHGVALAVKYYDMLEDRIGREIHYCNYGDTPPDVTGADVIVGDFSFPRETLIDMRDKAASLVVLDHHKTARADLEGLDFCIFDMERSGAVLTWEYLLGEYKTPKLLEYIQDRDLWHWCLPDSRAISSYLQTIDFKHMQFNTPGDIERWLHMENFDAMVSAGEAILNYQQAHINKIAQRKDKLPRTSIGGYDNIICINATTLISETGNALCEGEPFVAMYFDTEKERVFSLRSCPEGIDVSQVAKRYGGGGHPRAAGFSIPRIDPLHAMERFAQKGDQ
jgi:oligoribonuclease NrnB/cAMP/cGMP phosphodiesterase (DHH superfamily)